MVWPLSRSRHIREDVFFGVGIGDGMASVRIEVSESYGELFYSKVLKGELNLFWLGVMTTPGVTEWCLLFVHPMFGIEM